MPFEPKSILDCGCGIGLNVPYLYQYFPNTKLYGCDVSKESVRLARENIQHCTFDAIEKVDNLKIYEKMDCIFFSTVLHHIPHGEHERWLTGLFGILNNGGYMVIFEHNMKNPLTKRVVERTPMDKDAAMLDRGYCKKLVKSIFGKKSIIKHGYTYFFPWGNKILAGIEHKSSRLPLSANILYWLRNINPPLFAFR